MARLDEPRASGRLTDLLMMRPVLAEVARGVQPDGMRLRTGPADRTAQSLKVDALPELDDLIPDLRQQPDEQRRTDTARRGDPLIVDAVEKAGERLTVNGAQGGEPVPVHGKSTDMVTEHMRGDVLDTPSRADGGPPPLIGAQAAQQVDEGGLLLGEQRPDVDQRAQVRRPPIRASHWPTIRPSTGRR